MNFAKSTIFSLAILFCANANVQADINWYVPNYTSEPLATPKNANRSYSFKATPYPYNFYETSIILPSKSLRTIDANTTLEQYFSMAEANERLGNIDAAIDNYGDALRKDSKCVDAYINRARLRFLVHNTVGAIADYNLALHFDPNNKEALIGRAEVSRLSGRNIQALSDYNKMIEKDPQNPDAYIGRALVNYNLKRFSYSVKDLEIAKGLCKKDDTKYASVLSLINQIKKDNFIR